MDPAFWHARWEANEIGFHREEIHVYLRDFWPELGLKGEERVFVPLCGKSNDMLWLLEQGHPVLGVEINSLAVAGFFRENDLQPETTEEGEFIRWRFEEVSLLQGDFFKLTPAHLAGIRAVYDRASLIALPPPMRRDYAGHLTRLLEPGARMLLITLEYPRAQLEGPPFSVHEEEVRELYAADFEIRVLREKDILTEEPGFARRGLTQLREHAYFLQRRRGDGS